MVYTTVLTVSAMKHLPTVVALTIQSAIPGIYTSQRIRLTDINVKRIPTLDPNVHPRTTYERY